MVNGLFLLRFHCSLEKTADNSPVKGEGEPKKKPPVITKTAGPTCKSIRRSDEIRRQQTPLLPFPNCSSVSTFDRNDEDRISPSKTQCAAVGTFFLNSY